MQSSIAPGLKLCCCLMCQLHGVQLCQNVQLASGKLPGLRKWSFLPTHGIFCGRTVSLMPASSCHVLLPCVPSIRCSHAGDTANYRPRSLEGVRKGPHLEPQVHRAGPRVIGERVPATALLLLIQHYIRAAPAPRQSLTVRLMPSAHMHCGDAWACSWSPALYQMGCHMPQHPSTPAWRVSCTLLRG